MKTKEEKLIEAIGDTKDSNVLRAVGQESADPNLKTEVRHMEIIDVPKPSEADIRRYRIRNGVLGGLAAAVAITGGVVLWNNLRDNVGISTPAESSSTEPIVTITTPVAVVDPLSIITDTSMPEPFAPNENSELYGGDGWHDEFNDLWQKRFTSINTDLIGTICTEFPEYINRAEELATQYQDAQGADIQAGNVTRYSIDDTPNVYRYMKELGMSGEKMQSALIKYDNDISGRISEDSKQERLFGTDTAYILWENKAEIAVAFKSEYSIVSGEYVLSPRWMYYHTIEDYEKVGITAIQVELMISNYKELGFTNEAWKAFMLKLNAYTSDHKDSSDSRIYVVEDHDCCDITSSKAMTRLEQYFYGSWKRESADETVTFTYSEDIFDHAGFHRPFRMGETEDICYMECISSGESEVYVIEKNDPTVMYCTSLVYYNGNNGKPALNLDAGWVVRYEREETLVDDQVRPGKISVLGLDKLFSLYSQYDLLNYYQTEANEFDDDFGVHYTAESDMLVGAPDVYLVSRSEDQVTLGLRYFNKAEYDAHLDSFDDAEKLTEYYFAVTFTHNFNGKWTVSYGNLSDVYADIPVQTYRSSQMERYISEVELKDVEIRGDNIMYQTAKLRVTDTMDPTRDIVETEFGNAYIAGLYGHVCGRDIRVISYGLSDGDAVVAILFPMIANDDFIVLFFLYDGERITEQKDIYGKDDGAPIIKDISDIAVKGNSITVNWVGVGVSGRVFGNGKPFAYVSGN